MQLASGCMWIWFADSIPALVGFLRALRFPPTPKNRNPFIFLVNSFWSLVVCIKPACLPEVWLPMCALWLSHSGALRTQWVAMSRVTITAYYYYYWPTCWLTILKLNLVAIAKFSNVSLIMLLSDELAARCFAADICTTIFFSYFHGTTA